MNKVKLSVLYGFAVFIGLLIGDAFYIHQPLQQTYEVSVKLGVFNGRPVEDPSDLSVITKSASTLRLALGNDSDFLRFSNEIASDGNYQFNIKGSKTSAIATFTLRRNYLSFGTDNGDMGKFLTRIAEGVKIRHTGLIERFRALEADRYRLYNSYQKSATLIFLKNEGFPEDAEILGEVRVTYVKRIGRLMSLAVMTILVLGAVHLSLASRYQSSKKGFSND